MYFKNAQIFCSDFQFHTGAFQVTDDGRFGAVLCDAPADAVDLGGAKVIPGLVDVHIHGCAGADFSDGDYDGLAKMAKHLASVGVTSFAPASMTLPYETLSAAYKTAAQFAQNRPDDHARLMGIHMEGPFFSEKKKGAQNGAYLKNPDLAALQALHTHSQGLLAIADLAPELPGAAEFIEKAKALCTVSIAHTDGDYDSAVKAIEAGVTHLTHLFNAMPPIGHRNPGVIPAAAQAPQVRAELICDGLHVHPACVRLAYSLFGDRLILISDALRCCGMPEGTYELGGQQVQLSQGIARLSDGTIAGAATDLYQGMRNAMAFGIPETAAIRAATHTPACAIGKDSQIGSIAPGLWADFLICSQDYAACTPYISGKPV